MSEDEPALTKLLIEPEPGPEELVAILHALRAASDEAPAPPARSRWIEVGRREQVHRPQDDRRGGWNQ